MNRANRNNADPAANELAYIRHQTAILDQYLLGLQAESNNLRRLSEEHNGDQEEARLDINARELARDERRRPIASLARNTRRPRAMFATIGAIIDNAIPGDHILFDDVQAFDFMFFEEDIQGNGSGDYDDMIIV